MMVQKDNNYLAKLNSKQRQAVEYGTGPLLVVAGAGTGKTTVLINRLLHLITTQQAQPDEILLTTFTDKAAGEIEARADQVLPYGYTDLWIHTFHSFGERLLRQHGLDIGLNTDFKLLNETAQWVLLYRHLDQLSLNYYRPLGNQSKFLKDLLRYFSLLKDENISTNQFLKFADQQKELVKDEADQLNWERLQELAQVYKEYNQILLNNSYLDFGDLIGYSLQLFQQRPNILRQYRQQFKFILVDEFQDTNWAQYELIKLLAAPNNNLTVVGDDDQSIYRFRGASLANVLQFKDDFPQAQEIVLTTNYRSGQPILDQAYQSIQKNNPDRLEIKLGISKQLTATELSSGSIEVWSLDSEPEEVVAVIDYIKQEYQQDKEVKWSDFAILTRTNRDADKFVNELTRSQIPCQFVSLRGLYYKPIILDCLAYLRLLNDHHQSAALYRVFSSRPFSLLPIDLMELSALARRKSWSLFEAAQNHQLAHQISPAGRVVINQLLSLVDQQALAATQQLASRVFVDFVYQSGLLSSLDQDSDWEVFHYLNQFYKKIKEFENSGHGLRLNDFIDLIDLEMEAGEAGSLSLPVDDDDLVKVMTIHSAKGLEFKTVFLPDLVNHKFPTRRRSESLPLPDGLLSTATTTKDMHLAEERRLFYVAITRAQEKLILIYARDYGGARDRQPSAFLKEINLDDQAINRSTSFSQSLELVREVESLTQSTDSSLLIQPKLVPSKFSFSQFAAHSSCPLQYKFNFILKIPVPEKAPMVYGRLMHRCLYELMLPHLVSEQASDLFGQSTQVNPLTKQGLLKVFYRHWIDDGYASADEREQYRQLGQQSLLRVWQLMQKDGYPQVLGLEKKFTWKINDFLVHGTIDRIDQLPNHQVELIDYKTGNPKEKLDYEDKRQLILYQLAVEDLFGWSVGRLSFHYLNNGTKLSFVAKSVELDKVKQEIVSEVANIRQGIFPAKPGPLCNYCDFRSICQFRQTQ